MASPHKFTRRKGFATPDGPLFEVNMAALLFLRGLNSSMDFQLATNVDDAGAMDDVVFRFKPVGAPATWTTLFIQLKFKANRPVHPTLLTNPKGDFSVPKYFESYREIKQTMSNARKDTLLDGSFDKCEFVIFTNTKASDSMGQTRFGPLSQARSFVWCDAGKFFSFEGDAVLSQCLANCGNDGTAFLDRLGMFCGQPNADGLEAAIQSELGKVDGGVTQGVDSKSLCECFLRRMKMWCQKSNEVDVLHKGDDILQSSVMEIISQQTEKKFCLDIAFDEVVLEQLRVAVSGNFNIFTVHSSERSCRLSLTKLFKAVEGQPIVLNCEGLLANKGALLAQCMKGVLKSLIVCTNDWSASHQVDYFKVTKDLLDIPTTPKIVFVANDENDVVGAIAREFRGLVTNCKNEFTFSQLTEASRETVLDKLVTLQGNSTTLKNLLKDAPGSTDRVLDACSVVEILECDGSLTLGSTLSDGIGYYVDRSLELANVVKASVFQDGALQETVTIRVMDCDASTSFGPSEQTEKSISQQAPRGFSDIGLIEKTVHFLSLHLEWSHQEKEAMIVNNLACSSIPETGDSEVAFGPKFPLSSFECNLVALRNDKSDSVLAVRVRTNKHATQETCFLFVSDKTNENDLHKLSAAHKSKHLLSLKDDTLRWIESAGDIELIRPHMDESQNKVTKIEINSLKDIEDRLVLVCAEPGMGKSTLTARLAGGKNICDSFKDHFIFVIALNDHCELFAESKDLGDIAGEPDETLEFLCKANKIDSHLHRSLLRYALEVSGNVVVFFDGYDEVAQKYGDQCCGLISNMIHKTKAKKIWVLSRNSFKKQLEIFFSKFALNLCRFDEADQKNFLKKFWEGNPRLVLKNEKLDQFIDTLLEKTYRAVRDVEKDLMAIPLQTRMLAEVFEDHVTDLKKVVSLPDILNLLDLLEKFVDKKCSIYVQDKFKIEQSKVANYGELYGILKKEFVRRHMNAALGLILDDDTIKSLRLESIIRESHEVFEKIRSGADKTGFIDDVVNDKPRFIHRVFAEFFVAKWFSENFPHYPDFIESKLMTDDFSVVRNLFDRLLAKGFDLHTAVINEDLDEVQSLLERDDIDVDGKDGGGRTAMHLAASRGTSENSEENKKCGEILEVLINKTSNFEQVDNVLQCSPQKYAGLTKSWIAIDKFLHRTKSKEIFVETLTDVTNPDMIDNIFVFDLHNLLAFCIDNGLPVEHCSVGKKRLLLRACEKGSLKTASLLVERNANINNTRLKVEDNNEDNDGVKEEVEGETPLHVASENGKVKITELLISKCSLTNKYKVHNGALKSLDASKYINIKNSTGNTALHIAARNGYSEVVTILVDRGGDVSSLNVYKSTPLHLAAQFNHPIAFNLLLKALAEADRAAVLSLRDNDGDSVLSCAAYGGSLECVDMIIKSSEEFIAVNTRPFLADADGEKREVSSSASAKLNGNRECMTKTDFLNLRNNNGKTAIHRAAWKGHAGIIRSLVSHGCDAQIRDNDGTTPLHMAAISKHPIALSVLLDALDDADRAAALSSGDKVGDSVLSCAAYGGCLECVELIIKSSVKITKEFNNPLLAVGDKERQEVANSASTELKAIREAMTGVNFLNMRNQNGKTAIHRAAWNGHADVISCLISHGCDIKIRDDDDGTPLHLAARNKNPLALACLIEALDEADRAATLILGNKDGDSVLSWAALGGSLECVEIIVKASEKFTSVNKTASISNSVSTNLEGMSKVDFINLRNKNGKAAIHRAAWNGHADIIRYLIRHGCNIQLSDDDDSTPLHLAAHNKNHVALSYLIDALDDTEKAATLTLKDKDGDSVLSCAAYGGCLKCVKLIIMTHEKFTAVNKSPFLAEADQENQEDLKTMSSKSNANRECMSKADFLNLRNKYGKTAIHRAAWKGHADIIRFLKIHGCDTQVRDDEESTPLHLAAQNKNPVALACLLDILDEADRPGALMLKNDEGDSVLSCAAYEGCLECVELIIKCSEKFTVVNKTPLAVKADEGDLKVSNRLSTNINVHVEGTAAILEMLNERGSSAMHRAAWKGNADIIRCLISHGCDPRIQDAENCTPIHVAARMAHPDALKVLLAALKEADKAAVINQCDGDGDSVLFNAAYGGCVECVQLIFESGGKMTQAMGSPLVVAAEKGHNEVVSYLLNNFDEEREGMAKVAFLNLRNVHGKTAIHRAVWNGHTDIIRCLISHGCDTRILDHENSTPIHMAAGLKHIDSLRAMLNALKEADKAAVINQCDGDGDSVLFNAAYGGCVECVQLIFESGGKMTQAMGSPLVVAAEKGHNEVVSYLLNNFDEEREGMAKVAFLNLRNVHGKTAIHRAAWNGHADIIRCLISHSCDTHILDHENTTPMHMAARMKHIDSLRAILNALKEADKAAVINQCDGDGDSVLFNAAYGGCVECVQLIFESGGKMAQAIGSPLVVAAEKGHHEVVTYLLNNFDEEREGMAKVAFLNLRNKLGKTAIHRAAWNGHADIIRCLISHGCDTKIRDLFNSTPFHLAAQNKKPLALTCLLEALDEADGAAALIHGDNDGDSALSCAAFGGCLECVELIVKSSEKFTSENITPSSDEMRDEADHEFANSVAASLMASRQDMTKVEFVNLKNNCGKTAIHRATWMGHTDIVRFLVSQGGDSRIGNLHNSTPLHLAAELKHPDTVRFLLGTLNVAHRAAAVNQRDNDGDSVLMCGALGGNVECVQLLVEAGGKFCQANNDLQTSLMYASKGGSPDVVGYLLRAFGDEREGFNKLAFIDMVDKDGKNALDFGDAGCSDVIANCRALLVQRE